MKELILETLTKQYEAGIAKHVLNVEIMRNNPQSIPEHTDYVGAIDLEIAQIAEYEDKLAVLNKYFRG